MNCVQESGAGLLPTDLEALPAQSLEPSWGRASSCHYCSGSAAKGQDLCKTVIATKQVNWATSLRCMLTTNSVQEGGTAPLPTDLEPLPEEERHSNAVLKKCSCRYVRERAREINHIHPLPVH